MCLNVAHRDSLGCHFKQESDKFSKIWHKSNHTLTLSAWHLVFVSMPASLRPAHLPLPFTFNLSPCDSQLPPHPFLSVRLLVIIISAVSHLLLPGAFFSFWLCCLCTNSTWHHLRSPFPLVCPISLLSPLCSFCLPPFPAQAGLPGVGGSGMWGLFEDNRASFVTMFWNWRT